MNTEIFRLTEEINKDLEENNLTPTQRLEIAEEIKPCLSENTIIIAQCNSIPGDLQGNALKAKRRIDWANLLGAKAIIFPELFLNGNPVGDYLKKFPIVMKETKEWLNNLAVLSKNTKVIIGFAEEDETKSEYYNSVAVLQNGKIEKIIRKSKLSDTAEAHESRIFNRGDNKNIITDIGSSKAAILIGEDEYNAELDSDYIIICDASISRTGKEQLKHKKLSQLAKQNGKPVIYTNYVGASDCLSYDGASRIYNSNGELIFRTKSFEEDFFITDPVDSEGKIYLSPEDSDREIQKEFSLDYEADLERTYKTLIQSVKAYFKKNGFTHACLGLSGGLDSTVCAVLLADTIGKEKVFGISMPSKITSSTSKNDAKELAENLGIHFLEAPIKDMFDATRTTFDEMFDKMGNQWNVRYKQSFTNDNIQARARATILWGIANEFEKCIPIATSDKSEAYMGYATINGDMSGGFAPIADITKTKLFALAKWLNKNRATKDAIPVSIIEKRPGAELAINPKTGKPLLAEEALMPYEFLDEVIWRVENLHQTITDMVDEEFVYEKTNQISPEQKTEWLRKFFRRMGNAAFKGTLMPPAPIADAHSINKAEYTHPITSGINYEYTDLSEKLAFLKSN